MLSTLMAGSWKTSVWGILEGLVPIVIEEMRNGGGMPSDPVGWVLFGAGVMRGIGGLLQKDANKTHAPEPLLTPKTLSVTTGEVK